MKKIVIIILVLLVISFGVYYFVSKNNSNTISNVSLSNTKSTVSTPTVPILNTSAKSPITSSVIVNIKNLAFNPQILKIKVGTKVTWVNDDPMAHTVTSDLDNLLNSSTLSSGQSFSFTFNNTGTMNYHCNIHKTMKGTVVVE